MITATFTGKLKAYASDHPLQTILELVLTDFEPNSNGQMIPRSEAENIISTARNMPLKVFLTDKPKGHAEAYPIGTLTDVWIEEDVIKARSILWKDEYPREDEYLRRATAEGKHVGTSWEVYYTDSATDQEVTQLLGCIFASTVIVDRPAYGMRTPILSIAEDNPLEELKRFLAFLMESLHEEEEDRVKLESLANSEEAFAMLQSFVEYLKNKELMSMSRAESKDKELAELQSTLESTLAELTALKQEKTQAEEDRKRQELLSARREEISDPEITDDFLLGLSEDQFTALAKTIKKIAKSEHTIRIPEPLGNGKITTKELAKALKEANN